MDRQMDRIRDQYQAYLTTRRENGPTTLIVVCDDGRQIVFDDDAYAVQRFCGVEIIPSLHHTALIGPEAIQRLEDAGFEIRYVNSKGGNTHE